MRVTPLVLAAGLIAVAAVLALRPDQGEAERPIAAWSGAAMSA